MGKRLLVGVAAQVVALVFALAFVAGSQAAATSPTSPVDLATPIDFGAAVASPQATVRAGNARFEVLGSGLIRMEYSPTGNFEDAPTVNILNRRFPVPVFRSWTSGGWLTIATSQATLRYRVGSGPFGPTNTSLTARRDGISNPAVPQWQNECPFDQVCDAGAATLTDGASIQTNYSGYDSIAGFIGGLGQASTTSLPSATWTVLGAPAGQATVTVRYANYIGALGGPAPRTIDLTVNGKDVQTLTLPATGSWEDWSTVTATVPLTAGDDTVGLLCAAADSCNVNLDTLSVAPVGATAPSEPVMNYLGGYTRGFDTATYGPGYSCPAGTPTASQCTAALPELHPGILDRAGYRLLDDTQSATWTSNGWVAPRAAGGDTEDGYLFVYGNDYKRALTELNQLTGPSPLLPEGRFGVWYSDYYPYTTADYEDSLIPAFRANDVPIDTLSVDTDWKSPNDWDGWEWDPALFPDPQAFLTWAKQQGIDVTLNIHASIADNDPQLSATQALAGTSLADDNACFTPSGTCKVWDWSSIAQAESYFALHQPFESQGVSFWWLDWCCDSSTASDPGVTPDNWINHLYAMDLANKGQRGFVLSRIGSSYQNPDEVYPGRAVVGPYLHACLHRRHLGDVEHLGPPGSAGPRRGQYRRALHQRRHRQLPRPAARLDRRPHRRRLRPAGPVRPLGAARGLSAGSAPALLRRQPPALGIPSAGGLDRRRLPAAARGARALQLYAGRPVREHGAPDHPPALPGLSAPAAGVQQPGGVPLWPRRAGRAP